jgi:hypothetical protein
MGLLQLVHPECSWHQLVEIRLGWRGGRHVDESKMEGSERNAADDALRQGWFSRLPAASIRFCTDPVNDLDLERAKWLDYNCPEMYNRRPPTSPVLYLVCSCHCQPLTVCRFAALRSHSGVDGWLQAWYCWNRPSGTFWSEPEYLCRPDNGCYRQSFQPMAISI